ncbi:MAG TPA: VOC family protein [Flavobacterium sp.]|jgi:hypothetical protein
MVKQYWMNLPVKDIAASKTFFINLGFTFDSQFESADCTSLRIGENTPPIMLFTEQMIESFSGQKVADPSNGVEVLISFDAESIAEVDEMAEKVRSAGGKIYGEPAEKDGWMYGFGFSDPDGHRWNMLYMDMDKLPKK